MAARRRVGASRRATSGATDHGYGVISYLVMGAVVLLIIAGAVLLVRMIASSGGGSPTSAPTSSSITECSESEWFDSATGACVPRTVCEAGQLYDERANTCAAVLPTVTSIAPSSGRSSGGTEVRVTGTGFKPGASLLIDGIPASTVTVVNDTTITATTPGSENLYPVDIAVANPESEPVLLDNAFTYVAPPVKRITSINPDTGSSAGGEAVIIKGIDFVAGIVVSFFGRPASDVTVLDATTLRVITPAGPVGPVSVNVRNPGDTAYTYKDGFRYVDQPPRVVAAVRPAKGAQAGGTKITITGSGFADGATVTVGGTKARKVVVVDSTRITAVTPAGALGPVDLAVRNPELPAAILTEGFTYVEAPTVDGIAPAEGPETGGTKLTITGTGFASGATVTVGGLPATKVKVVSPTTITAVTPTGTPGDPVTIVVANPEQPKSVLKKAFTYVPAEEPTKPTPTPKPKPKPSARPGTQGLPVCSAYRLPDRNTATGGTIVLTAQDLFPSSLGITDPILSAVSFIGDNGDASDGTIDWSASPPRITWRAGADPGSGTIRFRYTATSCSGTGPGVNVFVSSR